MDKYRIRRRIEIKYSPNIYTWCGYLRDWELSDDEKKIKGLCALCEGDCSRDIPMNFLTCEVMKNAKQYYKRK